MASTATRKRRDYAPRVPAEQRRRELLDAALHVIVTRGHAAATMESVAAGAGVTKPVAYAMFANRDELLGALLQREQSAALDQLTAILPKVQDGLAGHPADLLSTALHGFLAAVQEAPERWYCIVMPMPDMPAEFHTAREQTRALILHHAEDLGRWIVRSLDAPEALDPELIAHTLVTLAEMAARLVLTDSDRFQPDRFVAGIQAAVGLVGTRARSPEQD